jgi:hypothetical protein
VLDLDKVIYVWNGAKANAVEKSKAVGIATMIRDHERASHATIVTVDKYAKDEDQEAFWKTLGGKVSILEIVPLMNFVDRVISPNPLPRVKTVATTNSSKKI